MEKLLYRTKITVMIVILFSVTALFYVVYNIGEAQSYSLAEFEAIVKESRKDIPLEILGKYYDSIGPEAIVEVIDTDPLCHNQGHNVGGIILKREKDLYNAVKICGNTCTRGCFHGLMYELSEYVEKNDIDLEGTTEEKILAICSLKGPVQSVTEGSCFHGVGHALARLKEYDLSSTLNLCESYDNKGAEYYCASGAFMEYDLEFGEEVRKEDPLFPCTTVTDHSAACYRYRIRRVFDAGTASEVKDANSLCLSLDGAQRSGCFHGLGHAARPLFMKEPKAIRYACAGGNLNDKRACFQGAVGVIAEGYPIVAQEMCDSLSQEGKEFCEESMNLKSFSMDVDFDLYYYKSE